jgi:hypothetical protein
MSALARHFGHAYATVTQPARAHFQTDWNFPDVRLNYRAVFVGSKESLESPSLTTTLPYQQRRFVAS